MNKRRTVRINKIFIIAVSFLFALIIIKLVYVAVSPNVDGIDLKQFANNRNTKKEILVASRGSVYDINNEILAQNVNSYTVIAYLSESRTTDPDRPYHVVDKEHTAELLSPIINMTKERILALLNLDAYQVELGPGGRGITELVKEQIEALDLPGIDFVASTKRYYPNGNFLSYILGYSKTDEEGNVYGEFGIELYYNDLLTGKNGYKEYQQDLYGYQIANTPTVEEKAEAGNDVYLTIDTNIQMFAEQAIDTIEDTGVSWASVSVVNAKTGEILGVASSPNYDPNIMDIKSYTDPFITYTYEPGSTMKIFSFMAAIENGIYKGQDKYKSGNIVIDDVKIKDWNTYGWGTITYDEGFMASSNVAATKLGLTLGKEKLKDFYSNLGFGSKTKITLPNEQGGTINFRYPVEIANAAFGQGISITAIQMVQALTSIANDGTVLKPYIVKKVVNSETGEIVFEGQRTEVKKVASTKTIEKIKELMYGVVNKGCSMATGSSYAVSGFNVIGKTGTAQIASSSGGYLKGSVNYIRSFAGMFPKEDPQVIVYVVTSKIHNASTLSKAARTLIQDVGTYLDVLSTEETKQTNELTIKTDSYISKDTQKVVEILKNKKLNYVLIGDGTKVIKQYPSSGTLISQYNRVFLLTNSTNYKMPNIKGWSRSEITSYVNLINLNVTFDGYGYATSQSISVNSVLNEKSNLEVKLEPKYNLTE